MCVCAQARTCVCVCMRASLCVCCAGIRVCNSLEKLHFTTKMKILIEWNTLLIICLILEIAETEAYKN